MRITKGVIILSLMLVLTRCLFIRKQTIKQDDILGEIILIEEIRDTSNPETLAELLENNSALIEQELDYAAEYANLLLNTIEGELIEDNFINNDSPVFLTLEGIKDVVNTLKEAEHSYLEDVKLNKKAKDQSIIQQFQNGEAPFNWDNLLSDEDYYQHEILESDNQIDLQEFNQINQNRDIANNQKEENKIENEKCEDDQITDADIEEVKQYNSWIINDEGRKDEGENSKQGNSNFNVITKLDKGTVKMKLPSNLGVGPQIKMKKIEGQNTEQTDELALYKDPSILVGVFAFIILVLAIFYYFFKSHLNLRKSSSSSILQQSDEILLSYPSSSNKQQQQQKLNFQQQEHVIEEKNLKKII